MATKKTKTNNVNVSVNYIFHDTETTGIAAEDKIIETAHLRVNSNNELVEFVQELCNPGLPIKPAAAMTHGYRNRDVVNKPSFESLESNSKLREYEAAGDYYIAHNAPFDIGMLKKEGLLWNQDRVIDTLQVAKHLYKENDEVEMYKLQYFRYLFDEDFIDLEDEYMKKMNITHIQPHTALSDILILWIFFQKIKKDFNISDDKMVELTQTPVLETKIDFGNAFERGTPYEDLIGKNYVFGRGFKKGYEFLDWSIKNMNHSIAREYSLKYWVSQACLKGIAPVSEYISYLNWSMLFSLNEDDIKAALVLTGKASGASEYFEKMKSQFIKRTEERIDDLNKDLVNDPNLLEAIKKEEYLLYYFKKYRNQIKVS